MKLIVKIIIMAISLILFMMIFPLMAIKLFAEISGFGLSLVLFFAVNPILVVFWGVLAGTDIKRLWWFPFIIAAVFPPLFSIAISDFVLELYVYSGVYFPLGLLTMVITHFVRKLISQRNQGGEQ